MIIAGGVPISGFADGTFLSVENNEDAYSLQVGTDGEAPRSRTNNNSARFTITLQQGSLGNAILSGLHTADKLAPGGVGCFPVLVKDLGGTSLYACEKAWIVKRPGAEFGRESGSREWIIETDNLAIAIDGGN
jgi:hypothetical protein